MRSLLCLLVCCLASFGCTPTRAQPVLTCQSDSDCPADGTHRCDLVKHQCTACDGTCATPSDTSSAADSNTDVGLAKDSSGTQDVGIAVDASAAVDVSLAVDVTGSQDVGTAQDASATGG